MKKVAIVGVEGSGKTALMVSWGWHCQHQDRNGYYLSPDPNGGQQTLDHVCQEMNRMRSGMWPNATLPDAVTKLDWVLGCNGEALGEMSFLDFGGELYRKAFCNGPDAVMKLPWSLSGGDGAESPVVQLQRYVKDCLALIILINLRDVINDPSLSEPRTRQMLSVVRCMMDIMRRRRKESRVALVFSQADIYANTLQSEGSLRNAYFRHLGHVAAHYPKVALFAVSAVDKTKLDMDGLSVPASDFKAEGIEKLTAWVALQEIKAYPSNHIILMLMPFVNIFVIVFRWLPSVARAKFKLWRARGWRLKRPG